MRVLTVLELLQIRERLSGEELAGRLEVSVRTVQRYVARLQDLGVPVESTRGPGGSYRLRPGFRLPPMMFSTEEAFALALGLDALAYLGLSEIAPATTGAKAKLERVLPTAIGARVNGLRAALELDKPRWIVDTNARFLAELAAATQAQQRVKLLYEARGDAPTLRTVEPLGLMQHDGRWFLAAYCLLRGALRSFRVDRVRGVELTTETFAPRPDFDLRAFLYESIAFAPAPYRVEVWLALPPETLVMRLPRSKVVMKAEGEGSLVRCGVSDLDEFAVLLLYVGCDLQVREPPELKEAFARVGRRALELAI